MSFFGKTAKITSIIMMAAGGVVAAGSAAMLGIGTNYKYTKSYETLNDQGNKVTVKEELGVGSMNYGYSWKDGTLKSIDREDDEGNKISYDKFRDIYLKFSNDSIVWSENEIKKIQNKIDSTNDESVKKVLIIEKQAMEKDLESSKDLKNSINTAYSLMIAGAVLVSVSALSLIAGIIIFILNKKKA